MPALVSAAFKQQRSPLKTGFLIGKKWKKNFFVLLPNFALYNAYKDIFLEEAPVMKVGVFWETSPGAPKKKLTSIFEAKSEKIELFSCK